jgi:hypothetical protein
VQSLDDARMTTAASIVDLCVAVTVLLIVPDERYLSLVDHGGSNASVITPFRP